MKEKFINAHMNVAHEYAKLSSAVRLQVGAIAVKDDRIISIGYNGMPSGWDNTCETKEYMPIDAPQWLTIEQIEEQYPYQEMEFPGDTVSEKLKNRQPRRYSLKSKPEVLHAEANCLMKLAGSTESGKNAIMFVTHSPCIQCAKLIVQCGITEVYYDEEYRSNDGIKFLTDCGVKVNKCQKNIA